MKKCENCAHYYDCMFFYCKQYDYENFVPYDYVQTWQIEQITVPFAVIPV